MASPAETTTVRVRAETRDKIASLQRPGQTADDVISQALESWEYVQWRRRVIEESRDPEQVSAGKAEFDELMEYLNG